jgi:hypothetical protein
VIKRLRDTVGEFNIAVIYIHCDYRDKDNQSAADIIGSFAKQLASQARSIPVAVWEFYEPKAKRQETINLEGAKQIVNLIIPCFDCVYICVDALDECEPTPRGQLLDFLKKLTGTTLRLFLTGRSSVEDELLSGLRGISLSMIPIAANEEDIRIYLSEKFEKDRYPEAMGESLKTEISNKIVNQSNGM